jgi:hypothetical protein
MATSGATGYVPNVHHPEIMRSILVGIVETGDVIGAAGPGRTILGAALAIIGIVFLAGPPIWRGSAEGSHVPMAGATLEPPKPGAGFKLTTNWPGHDKLARTFLDAVTIAAIYAFSL